MNRNRLLACLFLFAFALLAVLPVAPAHAQSTIVLQQNDTAHPIMFNLIASANHLQGLTGAVPTVYISKNGGTPTVPAGTISEVDSVHSPGLYKFVPTSVDTGTMGELHLYATATGADPADRGALIVAYNPFDPTALGLIRLDASISSRSTYAGGDTAGTTTLLSRVPGTVQPQTGDAFARLGSPAGASVSADVAALPSALPSASSIANAVWAKVLFGTMSAQDLAVIQAAMTADAARTWTASTHTAVNVWYLRNSNTNAVDLTKPVVTKTTVYDSTNVQIVSQTVTYSNLP